MTDNEKREIARKLRNIAEAQSLGVDPDELTRLADELDPPREWRAKWPEHRGCLIEMSPNDRLLMSGLAFKGQLLYTGAHKLNMIPHDGGPCPVDRKQSVVIYDGQRGVAPIHADFAEKYDWGEVEYYCPVDPVRVDL